MLRALFIAFSVTGLLHGLMPAHAWGECSFLSAMRRVLPLRSQTFEEEKFLSAKQRYADLLEQKDDFHFSMFPKIDLAELDDPLNRLAFEAAANARNPVDALNLDTFLLNATDRQKAAAMKIVSVLNGHDGLDLSHLPKLSNDLYDLVNVDTPSLINVKEIKKFILNPKGYVLSALDHRSEALVESRYRIAIINHSLEDAADEFNLLRNPGIREDFKRWRREHENIQTLALESVIDGGLMAAVGPKAFALRFPRFKFFKPRAELVKKGMSEGYAALRTDLLLKNRFHLNSYQLAKLEASLNFVSKTYERAILLCLATYVASHWQETHQKAKMGVKFLGGAVEFLMMTKDKLQKEENKNFNLDKSQRRQIQESYQGILDFNRPLTPELIWKKTRTVLMQGPGVLYTVYNDDGKKQLSELIRQKPRSAPSDAEIRSASLQILNTMLNDNSDPTKAKLDASTVQAYQDWLLKNHPAHSVGH